MTTNQQRAIHMQRYNYSSHGESRIEVDGDLVVCMTSGVFNEEGVKNTAQKIQDELARHGLESWRLLVILGDEVLWPMDVTQGIRLALETLFSHQCLATAFVYSNEVQRLVLGTLGLERTELFTSTESARQWLEQH